MGEKAGKEELKQLDIARRIGALWFDWFFALEQRKIPLRVRLHGWFDGVWALFQALGVFFLFGDD